MQNYRKRSPSSLPRLSSCLFLIVCLFVLGFILTEISKNRISCGIFNTKHNCRLVYSKQQIMDKIEIFDLKLVSKHTERQSCAGSEIISW